MESVPIGPSATLTRATSAGPSPPPRNHMEDSNTSFTRKRPRLDSGERTHRSMSADPITASHSAAEGAKVPCTPPHTEKYSKVATDHSILTSNDQNPSKVTINVRDPAQNESSTPRMNGTHLPASSDQNEALGSSQTEFSARLEPKSSDIISVSSSPARSPEIEVAEIEDMNDERGETKWKPLASIIEAKDTQGALLEAFPFVDRSRSLRQTVILLSQAIEKRKLECLYKKHGILTLYRYLA